jgi:purine-cytosine permease-like protein
MITQGIVFSAVGGWAPVAADFNCRLPHDISAWKVFFLTFFGVSIPVIFVQVLGALLMTVKPYADAFGDNGDAGAVLSTVFLPWDGGGKVSSSTRRSYFKRLC